MADKARIVAGDIYGEEICKALGIDLSLGKVRRVIIDIQTGTAVRVYLDMFGTDKMFDVKLPTTDIEIITSQKHD